MLTTFSCVSYANAIPFVEGLRRLPEAERPRLLLDPPPVCADHLRRGEADAALVPSVELARLPGAVAAGPYGIASRREVRSVVLLSRDSVEGTRAIAVDSNSRTSVALLKILLARRYGIRPELITMDPDPPAMLRRCGAALLIGDAALRADRSALRALDLAAAWHDLTGKPFVFALWAARDAARGATAAPLLKRALALGMEALPELPEETIRATGLGKEELLGYLRRNIHFELAREERESLDLFLRLCREEGLLAPGAAVERAFGDGGDGACSVDE
jgi:chorismate dehydratase